MSIVEVTINGEVFNLPEEMASKWHEQAKRVTSLAKRRAEELARIWGTKVTSCEKSFDVEIAGIDYWEVSFPVDNGQPVIYQTSKYSESMPVEMMRNVCADIAKASVFETITDSAEQMEHLREKFGMGGEQ